ncbi:hypothetical protein [Streptomyces sp. NPDC018045]|uniref:hypothetical protein n=1 Tax=Streptomyces sp. NPDC018045 TaxID=3365037 RepID=UPI0037B2D847
MRSSALLALSAEGILPRVDYAIFTDTGREPKAVYDHLDRLDEIPEPAGIPILRVSSGNNRDDALNPDHRFASTPLHLGRPLLHRLVPDEIGVSPPTRPVPL